MIDITIDTESINLDELSEYFEEATEEFMDELVDEIEWTWRIEAANVLEESKEKYLEGFTIERDGFEISVRLEGWLPTALEEGANSFDLKPGFLKGNAYRIIPMGYPKVDRFRTVSLNSPPDSWWHPGIEPVGISEKVKEKVDQEIVPEVLDRVFSNIKI